MPDTGFCKIHTKRLSILADALEREEFKAEGHKWDYRCVGERNECGTAGCAIGTCAYVFPQHYHWPADDDTPHLIGGTGDNLMDAARFFGLTYNEADHIFYGGFLSEHVAGDWITFKDVTPQLVAGVIRAFLEVKGKETT